MQIFACPACGEQVWFHNLTCSCGAALSFDVAHQEMVTADAPCRHRDTLGCNWTSLHHHGACLSCGMTRTHPDLEVPENRAHWSETEAAKRWVLDGLVRWGWFVPPDDGARPVFDMLAERTSAEEHPVMMGHADGQITINVNEADPALRAQRQAELGEAYRTMTGHMRHELAHFLFWRLSQDNVFLDAFRALFGDDRQDYAVALSAYYDKPPAPDPAHITRYAQAHPHEDWAETVAHLLHLTDLTDSAAAAGFVTGGDAYRQGDTDVLLNRAVELAISMNHINRALGQPDVYPFVVTGLVREKLRFAHRWLRRVES